MVRSISHGKCCSEQRDSLCSHKEMLCQCFLQPSCESGIFSISRCRDVILAETLEQEKQPLHVKLQSSLVQFCHLAHATEDDVNHANWSRAGPWSAWAATE